MSDRTVNDIAAFLRGPVAQHGSGCLASEEAWAIRYERDVAFLLGALAQKGVDITPTPPPSSEPPEKRPWDYWEEALGLTILNPAHGFTRGQVLDGEPLSRRKFLEGYMTCVERGSVDERRAGHQNLLAEMKAIAMEGVPT